MGGVKVFVLCGFLSIVGLLEARSLMDARVPNPRNDCIEWVDPFWVVLTLDENRAALRADFARLFNFMDVGGNGQVTENNFVDLWKSTTEMSQIDSQAVFSFWAVMGDDSDPFHLDANNFDKVFDFYNSNRETPLDKDDFMAKWSETTVDRLPNKGCRAPSNIQWLHVLEVVRQMLNAEKRN